MKKLAWAAASAVLVLAGVVSFAQARDLDGDWHGRGNAVSGDCPAFDISVLVQNRQLTGKALQREHDYSIKGYVTDDGVLRGEVSYLWWTIAELTGELTSARGTGTWRTFKGPECEGQFVINRSHEPPIVGEVAESF